MKKNLFLTTILWAFLIIFSHNTASAGNTQVWLLILESWEVLSGTTSSYFPQPATWNTSTGNNSTWTSNGGGVGWGWSLNIPIFPIVPISTTWVIVPSTWTISTWVIVPIISWWVEVTPIIPMPTMIDEEMLSSYNWARAAWITTISTPEKARLDQPLLRSELAKMMVVFSTKVMGKTIAPNTQCIVSSFADINQMDSEEKWYIQQACELQIMGWKNDKKSTIQYFNPHKAVTRAEFGTVLSRFLYGDKYNGDLSEDGWYKAHLKALNDDSIMKKIDQPMLNEIRWYVMIMLKRIYK